jgi:hypothetical protein
MNLLELFKWAEVTKVFEDTTEVIEIEIDLTPTETIEEIIIKEK